MVDFVEHFYGAPNSPSPTRERGIAAEQRGRAAWLNDCLTRRGAEILAREIFASEYERNCFVAGYTAAYWSSHDINRADLL